jgi:drug/metabolite transporter (DMT)-like permease
VKQASYAPTMALLAGAATWGVLWYPYRLLASAGLDGIWSTILTYGLALAVGVAIFPRAAKSLRRAPPMTLLMAAAIGWSNLAYVLAVLDGEVMRVLLLFYLAPLWTVPIARFLLREKAGAADLGVMALAFGGAMVMLWKPEIGIPWPLAKAEWLGLAAGFLFALGNVLVRRIQELGDAAKSIAIWVGVTIACLVHLPMSPMGAGAALQLGADHGAMIAGIAVALIAMSLAFQYGLTRMPANRAIVVLLFELVVAAVAAYLLAGEVMGPREWLGGSLIVAASLASAWMERRG